MLRCLDRNISDLIRIFAGVCALLRRSIPRIDDSNEKFHSMGSRVLIVSPYLDAYGPTAFSTHDHQSSCSANAYNVIQNFLPPAFSLDKLSLSYASLPPTLRIIKIHVLFADSLVPGIYYVLAVVSFSVCDCNGYCYNLPQQPAIFPTKLQMDWTKKQNTRQTYSISFRGKNSGVGFSVPNTLLIAF